MADIDPSAAQRLASMLEGLRRNGMSPSDIVRHTHVSRTTIWRLTVGDGRMPSADTFQRIEAIWRDRCLR
ncbi:hypothetical protein MRS76_18550 [Rhizobiaceae bacterium n13]|uniref:Uncharacterized protein n=1 Tax=Ferirhizobium litorale TaxID=2927786 RepID=A0AAE3QJE9_9HYPH|nr:hypothetical protein [Fererhizobium litorale]MDI7863954.1 hypothetical protein [Fererhizobium litorale]MDI7924213.1 hypothetical protein [Fererhizobium litorale]